MPKTPVATPATEERRQQALKAAERCAALLKDRFGAKRVILFGSLAGQGSWRDQSDIDLAVEGLPASDFFKAYGACHDLLPPGMELDLVPLEDAYPEMRARILGEVDMPDDPILALRSLIEDELTALNRVVRQMDELLGQAEQPTWVELYAIAGMLHEFYNGVERIFERIVVGFGEGLPQGAYWHADLLSQIATAQTGRRPAVIDQPLQARLSEYLKFRHAYGYTLEWERLHWPAEQLNATLQMLRGQLDNFFDSLGHE